jgi:hypothetical protein
MVQQVCCSKRKGVGRSVFQERPQLYHPRGKNLALVAQFSCQLLFPETVRAPPAPGLWVVPLGNIMSYRGWCTEGLTVPTLLEPSARLRELHGFRPRLSLLKRGGYFAALHPLNYRIVRIPQGWAYIISLERVVKASRSKVKMGQKCLLGPSRIDNDVLQQERTIEPCRNSVVRHGSENSTFIS